MTALRTFVLPNSKFRKFLIVSDVFLITFIPIFKVYWTNFVWKLGHLTILLRTLQTLLLFFWLSFCQCQYSFHSVKVKSHENTSLDRDNMSPFSPEAVYFTIPYYFVWYDISLSLSDFWTDTVWYSLQVSYSRDHFYGGRNPSQ